VYELVEAEEEGGSTTIARRSRDEIERRIPEPPTLEVKEEEEEGLLDGVGIEQEETEVMGEEETAGEYVEVVEDVYDEEVKDGKSARTGDGGFYAEVSERVR